MTRGMTTGSISNRLDAFVVSGDGDFLPHRRRGTACGAIPATSDLTLQPIY